MTAEWVAGLVALIVALVAGGGAWDQTRRHGAETERRKQAEAENDALKDQAKRHTEPLLSDRSYRARLRRAADRLQRLRDREAKP